MGRVLAVLIALFSRGVYALDCPAGETPTTVYEVTSVSGGSCAVGDRAPTAQALADSCAAQGTPMHSSGYWKERFGENVVINESQLGTKSYGTPYAGPPDTRHDAGPEVLEGVVGTAVYHEITVCEGGNTCALDSGVVHHFLVPIDVSVGEIWCIGGCDVPVQRYAANGSVTQLMATGAGMGSSCTESDGTTNDLNNTTTLPDSSPGACVPGSSTCLSDTKSNCGYVNGEYRCVTSSQLTDDHPCVSTASGGVFCKADAPIQPEAPTNPDGSVSSPDAHFAITTVAGVTYVNYYGDTTVQNGSQNPGGDADEDKGKGDCGSKATPCHVVVDTGGTADGGTTGGGGGGDGDGESSISGGGNCDAPPACDGDAVQCYIANQNWTQNCVYQRPTDDAANTAFADGAGGEVTQGSLLPKFGDDVDMSSWLTSMNISTGAGCPSDIPVDLPQLNASFSIPFSQVCGFIKLIRALVIIGSLVAGYQIYMKGW